MQIMQFSQFNLHSAMAAMLVKVIAAAALALASLGAIGSASAVGAGAGAAAAVDDAALAAALKPFSQDVVASVAVRLAGPGDLSMEIQRGDSSLDQAVSRFVSRASVEHGLDVSGSADALEEMLRAKLSLGLLQRLAPSQAIGKDKETEEGRQESQPEKESNVNELARGRMPEVSRPAHRHVILSLAHGYQWRDMRPFVVSLRVTAGFKGDVIFFMDAQGTNPETLERLLYYNITRVPITWDTYPYFSCCVAPRRLAELMPRPDRSGIGERYFRFLLAEVWLAEYGWLYDGVMLSDVADVVFQAHPFHAWWTPQAWKAQPPAAFYAAEEPLSTLFNPGTAAAREGELRIGTCPYNQDYLSPFGQQVVEQMAHYTIICSGTSFGTVAGVMTYLARMRRQMFTLPRVHSIGDQGLHNFVLRNDGWPGLIIVPNGASPVRTMAYELSSSDGRVPTNGRGVIHNDDGSVVPVVHQYNRDLHLWAHIRRMYRHIDETGGD